MAMLNAVQLGAIFPIDSRVRATEGRVGGNNTPGIGVEVPGLAGLMGTVRGMGGDQNHGQIGVEFDERAGDAHDLRGMIRSNRGWFMYPHQIELIHTGYHTPGEVRVAGTTDGIAQRDTAEYWRGATAQVISTVALGEDGQDRFAQFVGESGPVVDVSVYGNRCSVRVNLGGGRGEIWYYASELRRINPPEVDMTVPIAATMAASRATPAPNRPRLRVTVQRTQPTEPGQYIPYAFQVLIAHGPSEDVTAEEVRAFLDRAGQRAVNERDTRRWGASLDGYASRLITRGIPAEIIAAAIEQAATAKLAAENTSSATAESLDYDELAAQVGSQPPIMVMGNELFKLYPVGKLNGAKALRMIRATYSEKAKQQAAAVIQTAKVEARMLRQQAERKMTEAEGKMREMAAAGRMVLPEWVRDNALAIRPHNPGGDYPWAVMILVTTRVDTITTTIAERPENAAADRAATVENILEWPSQGAYDGTKVECWLPIDFISGRYNYQKLYTSGYRTGEARELPHISMERCCMTLENMPPLINDMVSLERVNQRINQGMRLINLNSLLTSAGSWHRSVAPQLPQEVREYIGLEGDERRCRLRQNTRLMTQCTRRTPREEAEETFTPERLERLGEREREREIARLAEVIRTTGGRTGITVINIATGTADPEFVPAEDAEGGDTFTVGGEEE